MSHICARIRTASVLTILHRSRRRPISCGKGAAATATASAAGSGCPASTALTACPQSAVDDENQLDVSKKAAKGVCEVGLGGRG